MSDDRKARLAFIGAGGFATASLYPNIHKVPQIDLVAVCDLDEDKAQRNARNFGAREVYTDADRMLDEQQPDGVFVIGPGPMQYEVAPVVLERGIPVYVEKPSANTSPEARELAELAEANDTWGQVGFMKRFCYVYRMAKQIMQKDEFGDLNTLTIHFGQGPYPQIWGIDSARRAFLIGQLCHIFDLTRFLGGEVASLSTLYREVTDTQFAYLVNLQFESGAIGQLDLNALETKQGFRDIREWVKLVGFESRIEIDGMQSIKWQPPEDWMEFEGRTGPFTYNLDPAWTGIADSKANFGYLGEVRNFALRCLGEVDDGPDLWDSYESLRLGEAVYEATQTGETVEL
jgi:predicted dehydrogenase